MKIAILSFSFKRRIPEDSSVPCTSPSAWPSDWQALMVLKLKSPIRRNNTGQPAAPVRIAI